MNTIDTTSIVSEAITQALNKMAFLEAVPFDGEPEIPSVSIITEIDFTGPVNGTVRTIVGMDFAKIFAENVSGSSELVEQECIDAIKELVNVTCGLVLPMIADSQNDVFDVTLPHSTGSREQTHWQEFVKSSNVTVLDVEGFPMAIRLIIN